jgi:hypothetical protein
LPVFGINMRRPRDCDQQGAFLEQWDEFDKHALLPDTSCDADIGNVQN